MGDWVGERATLRSIPKEYWHAAYFTYAFFDETAGDAPHCYANRTSGLPAHNDLQVNRSEVLKLWPGEPNDIAQAYPNVRVADSPAVIDLFKDSERAKLIALLAGNNIASWARVSADHSSSDHVKLEGVIWTTHKFIFSQRTRVRAL